MTIRAYVTIEKGVYYDGFLELPLTPVGAAPDNPTWRGYVWIDENVMRIAPGGEWSVSIYDYEIGKPTAESLENHRQWYAGYNAGKAAKRRRWPEGDNVHFFYKEGLKRAWEEKGKPFDNAYWKRYWAAR